MSNEVTESLHRGSGSTSFAGKIAMIAFVVGIGAVLFVILTSPRWWDKSALSAVPGTVTESFVVQPEGDCEWHIELVVENTSDRRIEIFRSSVILDQRRFAAPLHHEPLDPGAQVAIEVPLQIRNCPAETADLDHGDLRIEHRTGTDPTWSDITLPE